MAIYSDRPTLEAIPSPGDLYNADDALPSPQAPISHPALFVNKSPTQKAPTSPTHPLWRPFWNRDSHSSEDSLSSISDDDLSSSLSDVTAFQKLRTSTVNTILSTWETLIPRRSHVVGSTPNSDTDQKSSVRNDPTIRPRSPSPIINDNSNEYPLPSSRPFLLTSSDHFDADTVSRRIEPSDHAESSSSPAADTSPSSENDMPKHASRIVAEDPPSTEQIVSYPGTSQYVYQGGGSACGLAALNCANVILGREREGTRGEDLLQEIKDLRTVEVSLFI